MASGVQLCNVGERVIVGKNWKSLAQEVVGKRFSYDPFQSQKLQLVSWVIPLWLCQSSACVCYYPVAPILVLVKDFAQTRTACVSVKLRRLTKIWVPENRWGGKLFFKVTNAVSCSWPHFHWAKCLVLGLRLLSPVAMTSIRGRASASLQGTLLEDVGTLLANWLIRSSSCWIRKTPVAQQ